MFSSHAGGVGAVSTTPAVNNGLSMFYQPQSTSTSQAVSQQPSPPSRRSSRGSSSHRPGAAMRVTKPQSASNSPRSALLQARRRTVMMGNLSPSGNRLLDLAYLPTPATEDGLGSLETPSKRPMRPLSWHPSSYQTPAPPYSQGPQLSHYPFPIVPEPKPYADMSPYAQTPIAYSGYASPASAFSPLSMPYSSLEAPSVWPDWTAIERTVPQYISSRQDELPQSTHAPALLSYTANTATFQPPAPVAAHTHPSYSSPPTPLHVLGTGPTSEAKMASEEAIPLEALGDDESEGEILYGMGLYDPPEASDRDDLDGVATPMSTLFGNKGMVRKGLKLEDAWTPPSPSAYEEDDEAYDASGAEE